MPVIDFKPFGALGREVRKAAQRGWGTTIRFAFIVAVLLAGIAVALAQLPR